MSDNVATNRTAAHQQRQIAKGLCRCCPQPLSPESKIFCELHVLKQREYDRVCRGVPIEDYLSHKQRRDRANEIAAFALANPPITLQELADKFGMTASGIGNALSRCGVKSGWIKL